MSAPSRLAAVALAAEPTYGTATAPTALLPWAALQPADTNTLLLDQSWRGSAAGTVGAETGVQESGLSMSGPVYADSIGHLLAGALGDLTYTAGTPGTWAMALLNSGAQQPPSYTVSLADVTGLLQWPGCKVASLQLSFNSGALLAWQAKLAGQPSIVPGSLSMPAPSAELVKPGWVGACQIGGSSEPRLLTADVTFTRQMEAKRNATGQQAPWLQRSGLLTVGGHLDVAILTDTYRATFLAGSATSLDLNFTTGAGSALRQLRVHCSQVVFTTLGRGYAGRWVDATVAFEAVANASDAGASGGLSPVKVTLQNSVGSGGY